MGGPRKKWFYQCFFLKNLKMKRWGAFLLFNKGKNGQKKKKFFSLKKKKRWFYNPIEASART